ncbi:zinc finger HIT domain-containing protein 3 [Uranotaenia lowii]|uniref:zinc finger HIT domain-containing protein 3 n=1 Tax=Uranotaenia lowii TaxID=190385 RepID=UPI00247AE508|nr:zinc finger HIT domain-containing protein 3 [Uranotaenia lowii]
MVIKCVVCEQNEKKYKCKTCEVPYCSLPCYRKHQETPCETPQREPSAENDDKSLRNYLYTTVDTVEPAKLEQLRHSEQLQNLLYNPHLRRLLTEIDTAPDARKAIRVAMMEPLFVEFADECLRVIEPPDANERHELELMNS